MGSSSVSALALKERIAGVDEGLGPVAVIATHGIGVHIRFGGINDIARVICEEKEKLGCKCSVGVRNLIVENQQITRAEITVSDQVAQTQEIHVYESYWSPIPKGHCSLVDVIVFLFNAGLGGLSGALKPFERWVFGGLKNMGIKHGTPLYFGGVLALLLGLLAIILSLGLTALTTALGTAPNAGGATGTQWLMGGFAIFVLASALAGLTLSVSSKAKGLWAKICGPVSAFICVVAGVITAAVGISEMCVHFGAQFGWLAELDDFLTFVNRPVVAGILWFLALGLGVVLLSFLLNYVGDLCAYLSSHKASKFAEVRNAIQLEATRRFRAVYSARKLDGDLYYSKVIVMGHSLGSVVSYDALNALINEDLASGSALNVVGRTKTYITYGSPLDKTAFIFRQQAGREDEIREACSATRQPMILDYHFRPEKWVNIWSKFDPVSGELRYYDHPDKNVGGKHRIDNVVDKEMAAFIICHGSYTNHRALRDELIRAV
jgi:hypothetical protein